MPYETLIKSGQLTPYKSTKNEIIQLMRIAGRDIKAAKRNLVDDPDWAYNMSYNALLQASRALIMHEGYRTRGGEQHHAVVIFIREKLGEKFSDQVALFDQMRRKRHRLIYETTGIVSKDEVKSMITFCEQFIEDIGKIITQQPGLGI